MSDWFHPRSEYLEHRMEAVGAARVARMRGRSASL
jgi:hypothetical protein